MASHRARKGESHPRKHHVERFPEWFAENEHPALLQPASEEAELIRIKMVENQVADADLRPGRGFIGAPRLEEITRDPVDARRQTVRSRPEVQAGDRSPGKRMMKTLQEMALARSEFGNPAGAGRPVTALSGDPALVPEKGIDETQIHPAADGPGIGGIHRIEQLGN